MAYLSGNTIHVDTHLSNVALAYSKNERFIAQEVAPIIPVRKQMDMIKAYVQTDWYRTENDIRAPGTEANRVEFRVSSLQYYAQNYALRADVTIEDRANADAAFITDFEGNKAKHLTRILMLNWESRLKTKIFNTSNVGTSANVGSAWTDHANSNPLNVLWAALDNVEDATDFRPNKLLVGKTAWRGIARNKEIIDKINKTGVTGAAPTATAAQVAQLLQIEKVIVARQMEDSNQEGQSLGLSDIWDDSVLAYYAPNQASTEEPSFMYSFRWQVPRIPNMNVRRLPFDQFKLTEGIEAGYYQDERILAPNLAFLITNVTSSGSGGLV